MDGEICKNVELLYSHSNIIAANRDVPNFNPCEAYHQAVDDQGATLTIVSANGGYIFGGYNPLSWISDFMYTETSESYLFQIANPNSKIEQ